MIFNVQSAASESDDISDNHVGTLIHDIHDRDSIHTVSYIFETNLNFNLCTINIHFSYH